MKQEKPWDKTHDPQDYLSSYMQYKEKTKITVSEVVFAFIVTATLISIVFLGFFYSGVFN